VSTVAPHQQQEHPAYAVHRANHRRVCVPRQTVIASTP